MYVIELWQLLTSLRTIPALCKKWSFLLRISSVNVTKFAFSAVSCLSMLQKNFITFNTRIFKKDFKLHFHVSIIYFCVYFNVCSILVLIATFVWNGQTTGWLSIRVNLAHSSRLTTYTRKTYGNRISIFRSGKRVRYTTYFCRTFY